MTDKSTPKEHRQRLRKRFMAGEEQAKTETALLELLLIYAIPRKDVQPLAKALIAKFGGLSEVLAASPEVLCQVRGIGSTGATLLKLADWLRIHYADGTYEHAEIAEPSAHQISLFHESDSDVQTPEPEPDHEPSVNKPKAQKKPRKKRSGLFGKAVLREAIEMLPRLPDTDSLNEIRTYLRENLHHSAESTRNRYTCYIVRRMFPDGSADIALRKFAKHFGEDRNLKEVCFYRFMKSEPLLEQVIEELLIPRIGNGQLTRQKLTQYLENRFPGYKSIRDCTKGLADALIAGGVAKADRKKITFAYRDISLPAFAFIFHSEFPESGMYDLSKAEGNRTFRAMLWNPDLILPMIYELRNRGLISKVSEIDTVRQVTTKGSLAEIVEQLTVNRSRS